MREFGIREEARRKHYGTHALKEFEEMALRIAIEKSDQ